MKPYATLAAVLLLGAPILAMLLAATGAVTTAGPMIPLLVVSVAAGIFVVYLVEAASRQPEY